MAGNENPLTDEGKRIFKNGKTRDWPVNRKSPELKVKKNYTF